MLGLALVALLAFGALSAGAASAAEAPRWKVAGSYLNPGATKSFTATSTSALTLTFSGLTLSSPAGECTQSGEIEGSSAPNPGAKKNVVLTCKNVTVSTKGVTCTVNSVGSPVGTITTNALKSNLVWLKESGKAAGDLLEPSGSKWTELEFGNPLCPLYAEKLNVTNAAIAEVLPVGAEAVTAESSLPATKIANYYNNENTRAKQTPATLKVGSASATLSGKFSFSLTSKEAVGASGILAPTGAGVPRWKTSTSGLPAAFLTAAESRSFTAVTTGAVISGISGMNIEMPECTQTGTIVGSAAGQPGTKKEVVLTCTGVSVPGTTCTIHTLGQPDGTIVSSQLKGTLVNTGPFAEKLEPQSGTQWFEWIFGGGPTCSSNGLSMPITGTLTGKVSTEELGTVQSVFPEPSSGLKYGAQAVGFNGSFNTTLTAKNQTLGVFPG